VFSRIIERRFYLGNREKESFRSLMWRTADFSGVNILTFCVMDNHFHILVQIPERENIGDREMLRRLKVLYGTRQRKGQYDPVGEFLRSKENPAWREKLRAKYLRRMYDLSEFMRTLKLRYSFWYNRNHEREGTLWDMRFKSVLVQGPQYGAERGAGNVALTTVAAYIDLNCVRAKLVEDPKDYRWCGYAGAVVGEKRMRLGLRSVYGRQVAELPAWNEVASAYRSLLLVQGQMGGVEALPRADLLRCKIRYFTRGAVLGSQQFVDQAFARHRWMFSDKRKTGARRLRGDWEGLCAARDVK
jgi:REP element-mobilizing transposase RayT